MRIYQPWQASPVDAAPLKNRDSEPSMRSRMRLPMPGIAVLGLLCGLAPRPVAAQSCTAPSFVAPTGPRLIPTTVFQPGHIAVGDFNRDGRLDFVVTDLANPNLEVFLQNPPGSWSSV